MLRFKIPQATIERLYIYFRTLKELPNRFVLSSPEIK